MKKLFVLTLALFTVLTLGAFAQDQTAASGKKSKKSSTMASDTSTTKAKTAKLTGTIGQDGKTFTTTPTRAPGRSAIRTRSRDMKAIT